jgi:hypothetical protein
MRHAARAAAIVGLVVFLSGLNAAQAQVSPTIFSVGPDEAVATTSVTIRAELRQLDVIERLAVLYRPFGTSEFTLVEMDLAGSAATATLPASVVLPPFLEYYIAIVRRDGSMESFPVSQTQDPFLLPPPNTLRLPVRAADAPVQILFLSPEATEVVEPEDVVVAISLLRADTTVVQRATIVTLDGVDVTDKVVFAEDLLVFSPSAHDLRLTPGVHRVGVRLFSGTGAIVSSATHLFTVRGDAGTQYTEPVTPAMAYNATVTFETRHERIGGVSQWYNRGGVQFAGRKGIWRLNSNLYVTSEEDQTRQPQNRFYLGVSSPWLTAGVGDHFPVFPSLLLLGRRVRGANASVRTGFFNIDATYGQISRPIEGALIDSFPQDSLSLRQQQYPGDAFGQLSDSTWGRFHYGTYERTLFAVRPSFGTGEDFQLGFTWLSSSDDVSSIQYGVRPQENVVVGTDLLAKLDGEQLVLTAQAAFSAFNSDISSGSFTDAYIDTVFDNPEDIRKARDILSRFITVNENLRPLSLSTPATLAYEATLAMNYFDNALRATYLYRGSDYTSFGQTFLRKDVRGFNVQDRIRLVSNQALLTLGWERLQDNTSGTKPATTTYTTLSAGVSLTLAPDLPVLTLGYNQFRNRNPVEGTGVDSLYAVDDRTNRIFGQASYDFELGPRHTALLSVSTSDRADFTVRHTDLTSSTVTLSLISRFDIPLQTSLDLALNYNDYPAPATPGGRTSLDYTTIALGGRYAMLPGELNLIASIAPTFGDLTRVATDLGAEWYIQRAMSLTLQFSAFDNDDAPDDSFVSVRFRYDI